MHQLATGRASLVAVVMIAVTAMLAAPIRSVVPASANGVQEARDWRHIAIVEDGSRRAAKLSGTSAIPVRLPDRTEATLHVDDQGHPSALVFPASNSLSDHRERALEAGGALSSDQSVLLPTVTDQGQPVDVVIRSNGEALASAP